ncbi:MAG: GNAT family N-acetyltransferase [Polyangiaceae bacterium]|nr:GNAT family N-acetyltransferase [Polyangiaceae bacterium]
MPGGAGAPRAVDYFAENREHLAPWEPPFPDTMFSRAFWERRFEQDLADHRAGRALRLVLLARSDPGGPILGFCNYTQFVRGAFMACTLGYSLSRAAEGQGYMTEALRLSTAHVFDALGMHRIQANHMPHNRRSEAVLRRLGFEVEGYARDYIYIHGAWRDHVLTALTNPRAPLPEYLRTEVLTR